MASLWRVKMYALSWWNVQSDGWGCNLFSSMCSYVGFVMVIHKLGFRRLCFKFHL